MWVKPRLKASIGFDYYSYVKEKFKALPSPAIVGTTFQKGAGV